MKIRLPLRLSVPLALLIFVAGATAFTLALSQNQMAEEVAENSVREMRWTMNRLEAALERAARTKDAGAMQEQIASLAANPEVRFAVLADEDNQVLASMRIGDIGKPLGEVLAPVVLHTALLLPGRLDSVRRTLIGTVTATDGRTAVVATHPVVLGIKEGEIRPSRVGSLVVIRDFSPTLARETDALRSEALAFFLLVTGFAVGLGLFFHYRVAGRLRRLGKVAEEVGAGNMEVRSGVTGGDEVGELAAAIDRMVADRASAEAMLRVRGRAIESDQNGIIIADASEEDMPIIYCNSAFEKITGYPASEVLGRNCRFLQGEESDQETIKEVRSAIRDGRGCRAILRNFRKDGTLFWNELTISPVRDDSGSLTHFVGIQSDITEQKKTMDRLIQAAEEEQLRLGREMHDGLCQELFGIQCLTKLVESSLIKSEAPEAEKVTEILKMIGDANRSTRRISHGLACIALEVDGLAGALGELASSTRGIHHIDCEADIRVDGPEIGREEGTQVYRIAQEAVKNAIQHADAQCITISLQNQGNKVLLEVKDDGNGFEIDRSESSGMGIASIRHRAKMLGGSCEVQSNGGGTVVSCAFNAGSHLEQES